MKVNAACVPSTLSVPHTQCGVISDTGSEVKLVELSAPWALMEKMPLAASVNGP